MKTKRSSRIIHYGKSKHGHSERYVMYALCGKRITAYELQTGEQKIGTGFVTCAKCLRAIEKGKVYKDKEWE